MRSIRAPSWAVGRRADPRQGPPPPGARHSLTPPPPLPKTDPALIEADIARLVDRFYEQVRVHPTLGPVFNPAVHDWDAHKATLVDFWSSIALKTGRYRGQPMAMHRPHAIEAAHFADWLELWDATARDVLAPAQAEQFIDHARRIARSLMYGLGLDGTRRPLGLPFVGDGR